MMPQWIIEKKRDGIALSEEEIAFFINGYAAGAIPDYQASALAMAVFFRGMSPEETAFLTRAMMRSGALVDTSKIAPPKVDKHSTGGVGDKISIPLAPLAACCGIAVPMIAGRGLGITGGTIDKLESIPGYKTGLSEREFINVLDQCGCSIIRQTEKLVPADRKLYALRDVTGTVPSIPLIVASIMSKKLAVGADALLLDVKCGSGAFMKTRREAETLAHALMDAAGRMGRRAAAFITPMDQPLGRTVGNALEIGESVDILSGAGPEDATHLTLALCAQMLVLGGAAGDAEMAAANARKELESGRALERLMRMVTLHGGDARALGPPCRLPTAPVQKTVHSPGAGYVSRVDAGLVGRACLLLGAGRKTVSDAVDPSVGVSGLVKIGERVEKDAPLCEVHAADENAASAAAGILLEAFAASPEPVKPSLPLLQAP